MITYEDYAKYYDLLYSDKDYQKEADYVHYLISRHYTNKATILELGCGTGIHATKLAKKGFKVDGIDASKLMLDNAFKRQAELPKKVAQNLFFVNGDIRSFRNEKKYDTVMSLFHVASYMVTNEDIQAMFETANIHLNRDGLFIFDCWYGPAVLAERPSRRIKTLEIEEIKVVRMASPEIYPNENVVHVNYNIEFTNKATQHRQEAEETHAVRYFFIPELKHFLRTAGFEVISASELITGKKPGFDTWGVCFVTKKINKT